MFELTKSVDLNTFVDTDAIRTVLITNGAFAVILLPCIRSRPTYTMISKSEELVALIKGQLGACTDSLLNLIVFDKIPEITEYIG